MTVLADGARMVTPVLQIQIPNGHQASDLQAEDSEVLTESEDEADMRKRARLDSSYSACNLSSGDIYTANGISSGGKQAKQACPAVQPANLLGAALLQVLSRMLMLHCTHALSSGQQSYT